MKRVVVMLLAFTGLLFGQGTDLGTIRGTVTDASGAVVPKAAVEVIDAGTNFTTRLETDHVGNYEASALRSGSYRVRVTSAGFQTVEILDIFLRPGGVARADANLQPKTTTDTVVITSEAPLIQTDSPTIGGVLTGEQLIALPRDSRDIYSFLYLNPNITQGAGDGSFKFLGAQTYGASFSLDGQRSNGGVFGEPTASQPSLETVGELSVQSFDFTAEYAGIANIRVTTKRGGREYHGSMFYNNKNSALAAWDINDKAGQAAFLPTPALSKYPNPYFNLNVLGASFGGPIPKVKNTYFFTAYEHTWFNRPSNIRSTNLPHPTFWVGDFSLLPDNRKPVVPAIVTLTPAEIASNTVGGLGARFIRIPQRLLNPVTAKLLQTYYPPVSTAAPINPNNGRVVDFFTSLPRQQVRDLGTIRVDHDITDHDKIYAVYNGQAFNDRTGPVVSPFTGLGLTLLDRTNHTLSIAHTHVFGPHLINEARGGFNRQPTFRHSNQTERAFLSSIGFDQSDIAAFGAVVGEGALDSFGHPAVFFATGFANFTNGGRNTFRPLNQNLITFGDTATWIKGSHAFKFGADFVRNAALDGFTTGRGNPRGRINYTGGTAIDTFARFVMGLPANTINIVNKFRPPMDVYNWETGYFIMDEWKATPRLTLNLGIRYELITQFIENNDLLLNLDPNFVGPNGRRGRFVVPSEKTIPFVDPRFVAYGVVTAAQAGFPRALVDTDKNNLAPRVGVAWRLGNKMVLRGGYGLFYPTAAAQGIRDPLATNSFQTGITKVNNAASPLSPWPGFAHGFSPVSGGQQNVLSGLVGGNWVPRNLQSPLIHQYNVTFERELGWSSAIRASYLGTHMTGLISGFDESMLQPNDKPFGTTIGDGVTPCTPGDDCDLSPADRARLKFPDFGTFITAFRNFGHGQFHALQLEFNRRYAGGFYFSASYTLLDQKSTAPDTGNSSLGGTAYNQFKPESDYGTDSFVSRHRFITYGGWQLPLGRGRKYGAKMHTALDWVVGGWEASWEAFIKSGFGFTPFWFCDNCGGPALPGNIASESIDAVGGFGNGPSFRPVVLGEPHKKSGDRIWDPAAFGLMPLGADLFDNPSIARRNLLRGPGTSGVNLGVHKVFRVGERVKADLGADFNNLLNHPLLAPTDPDVGRLGNFTIGVDPRTLKVVLDQVTPNPDFGRMQFSSTQENVDSRRTVRFKLRLTF